MKQALQGWLASNVGTLPDDINNILKVRSPWSRLSGAFIPRLHRRNLHRQAALILTDQSARATMAADMGCHEVHCCLPAAPCYTFQAIIQVSRRLKSAFALAAGGHGDVDGARQQHMLRSLRGNGMHQSRMIL